MYFFTNKALIFTRANSASDLFIDGMNECSTGANFGLYQK